MAADWIKGQKTSIEAVRDLETKFGIKYPQSYLNVILEHDGGKVDKCVLWDIPNIAREKVFYMLCSVSPTGERNVRDYYELLAIEYGIDTLIPFAEDASGGFICFRKSDMKIFYYDIDTYEDDEYEGYFLCDTFEEFADSLYEDED